jgi:hypothetical protein
VKTFSKWFKELDQSIEYDPIELKQGIEVEKEHTDNSEIAEIIAKQHLAEDPKYYSNLKKVHTEAKKTRLDPKCWKGYKKQGTKLKGGVRVNNCVPSEEAEDIHKPVRPGILKRAIGGGKVTCSKAKKVKAKQKNKGNNTAKAAQRFCNYRGCKC